MMALRHEVREHLDLKLTKIAEKGYFPATTILSLGQNMNKCDINNSIKRTHLNRI